MIFIVFGKHRRNADFVIGTQQGIVADIGRNEFPAIILEKQFEFQRLAPLMIDFQSFVPDIAEVAGIFIADDYFIIIIKYRSQQADKGDHGIEWDMAVISSRNRFK